MHDERRSELLTAAERRFGTLGWHGTRLEDIAADAGCAKGVVFTYWDGKDALYDEVRIRISERYRGWHEAAHAVDESPHSSVLATGRFFAANPHARLFLSPIDAVRPHTDPATDADLATLGIADALARAGITDSTVTELVRATTAAALRGGLAGWAAAPGDVRLHEACDAVGTWIHGGLDGIGPLPTTGRRPRRASQVVIANGRRMNGEERRTQLLTAAAEEFAARGYESARLEDIAARCGVSRPAVLKYWPTKEALYVELRMLLNSQIMSGALASAAAPSPLEAIRAASGAFVTEHYRQPLAQRILLPQPSLPIDRQGDMGGAAISMLLRNVPVLEPVMPVLDVLVALLLGAGRAAILSMHELDVHPDLVASILTDWMSGGAAATAAAYGIDLDLAPAPQLA